MARCAPRMAMAFFAGLWALFCAPTLRAAEGGGLEAGTAPSPGGEEAQGPDGPVIAFGVRPTIDREVRACGLHEPLCVHASGKTPAAAILDVLTSAEHAWRAAT